MVLEENSSLLKRPRNCCMVHVLAVPGPPTSCGSVRKRGQQAYMSTGEICWNTQQEFEAGAAPARC